jgi:hypothetical protein
MLSGVWHFVTTEIAIPRFEAGFRVFAERPIAYCGQCGRSSWSANGPDTFARLFVGISAGFWCEIIFTFAGS